MSIVWKGNEDKPFYRAEFVSESWRHKTVDKPFWGSAVLTVREYRQLVGVIETSGLAIARERCRHERDGYYLEIRENGKFSAWYLGFAGEALLVLRRMVDVLTPENTGPVRSIIERLGG